MYSRGNCAVVLGLAAYLFIKEKYYCESGVTGSNEVSPYLTSDLLWDGSGCIDASNNCCTDVGLPWFYQQFPTAQQNDIEVRLCTYERFDNEGIVLDQLQLLYSDGF